MSAPCGGSSQHHSVPSCPVTCTRHCGVAVSPPTLMSPHVTKGPWTPCPVPFHGYHDAPCHQGPLHTLPPALGLHPARPKWPSLEAMPWPKCLRQPNRIFRNSSNLWLQQEGWQEVSCLLCIAAGAAPVRAPSLLVTALLLGTPLCSSPGTRVVPSAGSATSGSLLCTGTPAPGWLCQHPQGPPASGTQGKGKPQLCKCCLCPKQMQRQTACDKQGQFIYTTAPPPTMNYRMYLCYKNLHSNNL